MDNIASFAAKKSIVSLELNDVRISSAFTAGVTIYAPKLKMDLLKLLESIVQIVPAN